MTDAQYLPRFEIAPYAHDPAFRAAIQDRLRAAVAAGERWVTICADLDRLHTEWQMKTLTPPVEACAL